MALANAALQAAREVNADALEGTDIPEVYRAAAENLAKAKREYRLKRFDRAKHYAKRAIILAERAEFEAIKAGGATPEAAAARANMGLEGAPPGDSLDGVGYEDDAWPPVDAPAPRSSSPSTPPPEDGSEDAVSMDELESQSKAKSPGADVKKSTKEE
jgi:hypothetical protein